jgi:uncharacterized protein (DUF1330 family)
MAGYMIALVYERDPAWRADYIANVPGMIASYGGSYLAVGGDIAQAEGRFPIPDQAALFKFPSVAAIHDFLGCEAYAPFAAARQGGADTEILIFEAD